MGGLLDLQGGNIMHGIWCMIGLAVLTDALGSNVIIRDSGHRGFSCLQDGCQFSSWNADWMFVKHGLIKACWKLIDLYMYFYTTFSGLALGSSNSNRYISTITRLK